MLFGLFWGDWTVLVLIPAMIFAFWAQINVQTTFSRFKQVRNRRGLTAADVARRILDANGLNYVQIQRVSGELTDHYDPRAQVVRLSDSVYDSTSVAAIGVAAHEVGHACQHAEDYVPLRIRSAIIPMTRIGSMLAMPVFILGLLFAQLSLYGNMVGDVFMMLGILLFSLSTLFQLVTLPTEFNASARALKTLESYGILDGDELVGARSTLRAAALTYVAYNLLGAIGIMAPLGRYLKGRKTAIFGIALGGLLLAVVALSPLLKLDYDAIAKQIAEIRLDTETVRTGVEVQNRELQARIISEQAAAYIWDKADEMGVALEVEVETRDLGSGPYPWRATLTGTCGGEKRTALTRYIEENLAIPEARQVWQCE